MRAGSTSGGRGRRWGTRAAPRDDIDYGGAPSYSTGSGALPATKSPPYPVRRDEPRARGPDDVALFDAGSYLEEDDAGSNGARVGYGDAPQGYYPPFAPGGQMRGARRSRAEASLRFTLNSLVIGLVIFILGVPIAVGLSRVGIVLPSAGPQAPSHLVPTPPVATGYTGFENTVFSLAYPSNWLRSPAGGTFHGGAAVDVENFWDGGQKALVVITTNAVASDQVQSYFAEVLSKTGAVSPHQTGSGLALSYDGVTWNGNEYAATLTRNGQNLAVKARLLTATTGGTTYFIVIIAPQAAFDRAEKQTFEPILQSFRFQ